MSVGPSRHAPPAAAHPPLLVLCDGFPELSETFVTAELRALIAGGTPVRVEAHGRARRPDRSAGAGLRVTFLEDDGPLRKLGDLAWLAARAPAGCLRDLRDRRRWRREEPPLPLRSLAPVLRRLRRGGETHVHVHFAAGAALSGMRVARLAGLPYSVTAHGYDIFLTPRNLREKLESAAFATSGSDFTVAALRAAAPDARVHRIVMGVDGTRWRREAAAPERGPVLAVGRLVAKKGFAHLVDAAALLRDDEAFDGVDVVGDGPLHAALEAQIARLGLEGHVRLLGAREPAEVRRRLEGATLCCVPCVIAPDGDADSMPVIAKEALAMEVPVVAADVAGLPEVVGEDWGRLVPAGDAIALAAALRELLHAGPEQRARMGAAGRAFVLREFGVAGEAAKLAGLIAAARAAR